MVGCIERRRDTKGTAVKVEQERELVIMGMLLLWWEEETCRDVVLRVKCDVFG